MKKQYSTDMAVGISTDMAEFNRICSLTFLNLIKKILPKIHNPLPSSFYPYKDSHSNINKH